MRFSRRTNTIVLWLISIGLLVGMVIVFTPSLGQIGQTLGSGEGEPALFVNSEPVSELEVARARQNPLYQAVNEGEVADDLELLLVDTLIQQELLRQAAARVRVSGGEVRQAVNDFREARGVAGSRNDQGYLQLIRSSGFTDETFRDALREQIRLERYQEELVEGVEVSDEEVDAFYQINRDSYQSEERILARMIVVADAAEAEALRERALAGEAFGALAAEASLERADRAGALGAPEGSTDPQPVGRAALPTAVADAAFAQRDGGITEVVEAGGRFYLVDVEEYRASSPRPLEEVRDDVREDALAAKRQEVLQDKLRELRAAASVSFPETSLLSFDDTVVATVGDEEITTVDLARATYTNPQVQQALSPQTAPIITQFFKPSFLDQLIDQKLAVAGAEELEVAFIGPDSLVAAGALNYVARDVAASEDEIAEYYETNLDRFTVPASAAVTQASFDSLEEAMAFRQALVDGDSLESALETLTDRSEDLGVVGEGELAPELDTALFGTDAFTALPEGNLEVSDVLVLTEPVADEAPEANPEPQDVGAADAAETDAEGETTEEAAPADTDAAADADTDADTDADAAADADAGAATDADAADVAEEVAEREVFVVLVADRTEERVRPLEEVRAEVEEAVLAAAAAELRSEWLAGLRERIPVVNLLAEAQPDGAPTEAVGEDPEGAVVEPTPEEEATDDGAAVDGAPVDGATDEEAPAGETGGETDDAAAEPAGGEGN